MGRPPGVLGPVESGEMPGKAACRVVVLTTETVGLPQAREPALPEEVVHPVRFPASKPGLTQARTEAGARAARRKKNGGLGNRFLAFPAGVRAPFAGPRPSPWMENGGWCSQ